MRAWLVAGLFVLLSTEMVAQLSIVSRQKLPLDSQTRWSAPQFAPDGKTIYYTSETNDGIWLYGLDTKKSRQITDDKGAGYGFAVSPDGNRIAYRRTTYPRGSRERLQEVVVADLQRQSSQALASGPDVSTPVFAGDRVLFSKGAATVEIPPDLAPEKVEVLGIDNMKILVLRNGKKELFDPFGDGSYIWPVLSPDKKLLAAYEMTRGTFVCDLQGRIQAKLGRRDSPSWTRDGRWLVYMDDKDDGHRILSSELKCISPDGKRVVQITNTQGVTEMYPQCSPTENKIVCSTLEGEIYLLEYRERGR